MSDVECRHGQDLEDLIAGATARLHAVKSQDERDAEEQSRNSAWRQEAAFRQMLQKALGRDVITCLQPVTYGRNSGPNQMRFSIDGKSVELRQAVDTAVDLLEGSRELFRFDPASPMARDQFLAALGSAV